MPRRNRIDPWGDPHARAERGLFTGNRGCLVDGAENVVRHHRGDLWIICRLEFRGWRVALARPNRWTPLFFLDDAVALAAGHRPCGLCRRAEYQAYRDAVAAGLGRRAIAAGELNRRLAGERLPKGRAATRGVARRADRVLWSADADSLPDGTVVVLGGDPAALAGDQVRRFGFAGWGPPQPRPQGRVAVLTPPTSVLALAHGFDPAWHPSGPVVAARGTDTLGR